MVRVVYPLVDASTKKQSEYYTMTIYDLYKYKGRKYFRGKAMFFAEDLEDRPKYYKHINDIPKVIEDGEFFCDWKYSYNKKYHAMSSIDYVASVASYQMLTGK